VRMVAVGLAVVVVDQAAKWWVVHRLAPGIRNPVLPGLIYLTRVHNPGAAFGLFPYQHILLSLGALGVLFFAWWRRRDIQRLPAGMRFAIALGLGGATGNLIDRLLRSAVVDFIDLGILPVFNVADVAIVTGVALLSWFVLTGRDVAGPRGSRGGT